MNEIRIQTNPPDPERLAWLRRHLAEAHRDDPPATREEALGVSPQTSASAAPYQARAVVYVEFGQFSIDGCGPDVVEATIVEQWVDDFSGFTATGARFRTGIASGPITVEVQAGPAEPPPSPGEWEQTAEVTVTTRTGFILLNGFDETEPFPNAAVTGPGRYRARVSARGRALAPDLSVDEAVEEYAVQIWPERPSS